MKRSLWSRNNNQAYISIDGPAVTSATYTASSNNAPSQESDNVCCDPQNVTSGFQQGSPFQQFDPTVVSTMSSSEMNGALLPTNAVNSSSSSSSYFPSNLFKLPSVSIDTSHLFPDMSVLIKGFPKKKRLENSSILKLSGFLFCL